MSPLAEELLSLAHAAAAEASRLLLAGLDRPRVAVTADGDTLAIDTKTSATDLVTEVDRAAEALIVSRLLGRRPDDGVLGEEGAGREGTSGVRWIIDPIDGTTNYVYRHAGFAISIAAEEAGRTVVGVVADPLHGDVFDAVAGGGARRNGRPIRASTRTDLASALVATGFSYAASRRRRQAEVLVGVLPEVRDIRRMGAAAVDLCSVACGRVDAYYETELNPWDFAAGALVASEAGARVTDLDGGPPSGRFCVAAPEALHGPLLALLRRVGADRLAFAPPAAG